MRLLDRRVGFSGWLIAACWLLAGCELINPDEALPVRIHLSPIDFQTQAGQGSSRHQYTETWVYANSNLLGAFDPSATVHYTGTGPVTFTFRPGIRNNGILDDAITYPLASPHVVERTVQPGDEVDVTPVIRYAPAAQFSLLADFEQNNPFTDNRDTVPASFLDVTTEEVLEGSQSGRMVMTPDAHTIEVAHVIPMTSLPTDGRPAYLEFWYKNEIELGVGLLGIDVAGGEFPSLIYIAKPSSEWNMLYLDLSEWLRASGFTAYKILFLSQYPDGGTEPAYEIFLDNIKVVHL